MLPMPAWAGTFVVLLAAVFPHLAGAQFQTATQEELKMTADPTAPGAAAVYLDREEITDDKSHTLTIYERVKVLAEKGKELATVRVPYERGVDKVTEINGRTIHADGTVFPLTDKPADLMDFKLKSYQVNTIVITLPNVEVGCILEYRIKIRYPDTRASQPRWEIQQTYYVHKSLFSFRPFAEDGVQDSHGVRQTRLMYASRMNPSAKIAHDDKNNIYTLEIDDVPAVPDEDWMPPLNALRWRVEFYYTTVTTEDAFWQNADKLWAADVNSFIKPSDGLKRAAEGLVSPSDSEEVKSQKIYNALMKYDNTDFSREKSQKEKKKEKIKDVRNAEDVWKQETGTSDQIALLYVALARAAGLKAYPAEVVNRDKAMFDIHFLSLHQLDDYVAIVNVNGKDVFLDPGERMCPWGRLHWKHSYAGGLKMTDQGAVQVTTPAGTFKNATVDRVADLNIDPDGAVKGTLRFIMTGPEALHWRQMELENDQEEVKKRFNDSMKEYIPDGVTADFDHFLALDDYNSNLIGIVQVSGNIGAATGKRFFLPGLFFQSRGKHPFVEEERRITPVDVHFARMDDDEVTYHLPPGYTVESAPQATKNSWPDHAMLTINSTAQGDSVTVDRVLLYNFVLLGPKDYPSLHDFYQKVATADQQQLVLTRTPAAKGN
jgi:hypothetical protein